MQTTWQKGEEQEKEREGERREGGEERGEREEAERAGAKGTPFKRTLLLGVLQTKVEFGAHGPHGALSLSPLSLAPSETGWSP